MSEQGTPQPGEMPETYREAFARGDKETAQRLLDSQNAREGTGQGAGENNAPPPPGEPPMPEWGVVDQVAQDFRDKMGPQGDALVREWGGPEFENFRQNIGYVNFAMEHVAGIDPDFVQFLNDEIEDEAGNVSRLGDHPTMIRIAAKLGRLLSHDTGEPVYPKLNVPVKGRGMNQNTQRPQPRPRDTSSADERHAELTEAMHLALQRGDKRRANMLQAERSQLSRAIEGDRPIVGSGGRTA